MLAGLGGGDDLVRVRRVRGCQHDGVHARVGEDGFIAVHDPDALPGGEVGSFCRCTRSARDEPDGLAQALRAVDQILAPDAHADDGSVDHDV